MAEYWDQRADPSLPTPLSVSALIALLLGRWRFLAIATTAGLLVGALMTLLRPPTYTATLTFIPQSQQDQARGGLASLAGQFGIPLGGFASQAASPQLYADLLKTREVLMPIVRDTFAIDRSSRVRLANLLDLEGESAAIVEERTLEALRSRIVIPNVAARTTGAVTVRVRTKWPRVSLQIAERVLTSLHTYNLVTRQSQGAEERRFTEGRLRAAKASLRSAEDRLQNFLQRNRQFSNSPQLAFERDRLDREVLLQQQVVAALSQQTEEARIREVRDTPVISVIEQPVLPVLPDPRGTIRNAIVFGILVATLAVGSILLREGWSRQRRHEQAIDALVDGDQKRRDRTFQRT